MRDPFDVVIGQAQAVDQLRRHAERPVHAYLFVGPAGVGKHTAALAFAAAVLGDKRVQSGVHPDVITVEREGASINVAQAREIGRLAVRSPVEGNRKVLILTDFHLVDEAAPALLKTIEEASETTVFIILADTVTKELVTVASRCVRIDFCHLSEQTIVDELLAEGADESHARDAAAAAFGSLDRARLLVGDEDVAARRQLWIDAIDRLDGSGHAAASVAGDVAASIDAAAAPLQTRQADEMAATQKQVKEAGQANQVVKVLEARHKREQRRLRSDELRSGFATLAQEFARKLQLPTDAVAQRNVDDGLAALQWANESLAFNPNEALLLQAMFTRMSSAQ